MRIYFSRQVFDKYEILWFVPELIGVGCIFDDVVFLVYGPL